MTTVIGKYRTVVNANPEEVFAYVSDISRHGEWSANPLTVEEASEGPVAVGKKYRTLAQFMGGEVEADVEVTEYEPNSLFAFKLKDSSGAHVHEFKLTPQGEGTAVERKRTSDLAFMMSLAFRTFGELFIGRPGMNKSFAALKANLEK